MVEANRKGMRTFESKLVRGEVQISRGDVWTAVRWEDKRSVRMLTSVHELDFCVRIFLDISGDTAVAFCVCGRNEI